MERTDGILRMLKINYASSQDDTQEFSWKPALKIFTFLEEDDANALAVNNLVAGKISAIEIFRFDE